MEILKSVNKITELLTFDDSNVPFELWDKVNNKLSNDILNIRLDCESLIIIKHNNYLKVDLYWSVKEVDLTHCNIIIELPNPINDFDYYLKVRKKLITRIETLLKKAYTSQNLIAKG